ncbi:hypothetical protein HPB49_026105 [Dermacentor silvarum]|nr:hypothetical protein HPB49_026105 [Dermacentor silvarum]
MNICVITFVFSLIQISEEDPGPSAQKKQKRSGSPATKGQGGRKQSFREAWLEQDEFKGWLAPDPSGNSQRAFCKACGTTITTAGSELRRHAGAPSHKKATAGLQKQASVEDRIVVAENILNQMNSVTEAYLKFMKYALNFFNKLRRRFSEQRKPDC